VIYDTAQEFAIGGSCVLRNSREAQAVLVAAGITVYEALAAHKTLEEKGIETSVVDCYSIKPIDGGTLVKKAKESKTKTIITVEDHFYHGGWGDMVLNAVASQGIRVMKLAVTEISQSGTSAQLLDLAGISAEHIVRAVKSL
jgi:transketolase